MTINNPCEYRIYKNRVFALDEQLAKESNGLYKTTYILTELDYTDFQSGKENAVFKWGEYDTYMDCVNGIHTIVDCNFHH